MTENKIILHVPEVRSNEIVYRYDVFGPWAGAFNIGNALRVSYDVDMRAVPAGVAMVPLLANVLPMAWVYDAQIECSVLDEDFYRCIPKIKRGYEDMYPDYAFGGCLQVARVESNIPRTASNGATPIETACFFSGGVDAFNTLIAHKDERPLLITLRGSDVSLSDAQGWRRVHEHVVETAEEFDVGYASVSTGFRVFLREGVLDRKVAASGDGWWHGFQHGLGLLGHAAPLAWALGIKTCYIASSFTEADKGKVTCASDPSIDNHVRFCGARVIHDGYDSCRQDKVRRIAEYARACRTQVRLRVCWESRGGANCCRCEKCLRTMLALYAERADPNQFGFSCGDVGELGRFAKKHFSSMGGGEDWLVLRYAPIQDALRKNYRLDQVSEGFQWFYSGDLRELAHAPTAARAFRSCVGLACRIASKAVKVCRRLIVRL